MDAVMIGRAVLKRWYVAVLVIVVASAMAVAVVRAAPTTYQANATMLFVGPSHASSQDTTTGTAPSNTAAPPVNPYTQFSGSIETTANAVVSVIDGAAYRAKISPPGTPATYTVSAVQGDPLVTVSATGDTAAATVKVLGGATTAIRDELARLQDDVHAPRSQWITAQSLGQDTKATAVVSRPKVALAGLGLLGVGTAIVLCVGLERFAELRRERRDEDVAPEPSEGGSLARLTQPPQDGVPSSGIQVRPVPDTAIYGDTAHGEKAKAEHPAVSAFLGRADAAPGTDVHGNGGQTTEVQGNGDLARADARVEAKERAVAAFLGQQVGEAHDEEPHNGVEALAGEDTVAADADPDADLIEHPDGLPWGPFQTRLAQTSRHLPSRGWS